MKARILLLSLLLTACDPARVSQTVNRMTVLAIQSEPASAIPGETIALRALVVTPKQDDPIDLRWYLCQHPSIDECAKADDLLPIGIGAMTTVTLPPDAFEGDSFVVWLDATSGGRVERSLKAVPVRAADYPRNHNPVLDRVRWGDGTGGVIRTHRKGKIPVRAGSSQVVNELHDDSGEPAAEDVELRTWTSGGTLVDPSGSGASGELYWRAPPDKDGTFGAWIVANDGRGGVAWTMQWFVVDGEEPQE